MPVVLLEKKYPKCNANVNLRAHESGTVVRKRIPADEGTILSK
jgi:hypothetical protein